METVTCEGGHVSGPAGPYPPYPGTTTPPAWQQPYYQEQPRARRHGFGLAILLVLLVLLLVVGGLAWYVIPRLAGSSTPASQPGPVYPNVAGKNNMAPLKSKAQHNSSKAPLIVDNHANN